MIVLRVVRGGATEERLLRVDTVGGAVRSLEHELGGEPFEVLGGVPVREGRLVETVPPRGRLTGYGCVMEQAVRLSVEGRDLFESMTPWAGERVLYHVGATGLVEKMFPASAVVGGRG